MTRKEKLSQRAKEITEQLLSEGVCLSDGECGITDRVILRALQQVEREVIEQQAKEIAELKSQCAQWKHKWEVVNDCSAEDFAIVHVKLGRLLEALQICQGRLGCGCGDILCTTCSAAYDVADQALKEVL